MAAIICRGGYITQTSYLSFFYTDVLLGSIFLHMKARKLWQNKFGDKSEFNKFCIYTRHMWRISDFPTFLMWTAGHIWNFFICGEMFNFPTIVIHGKLKFLNMIIFSPLIILVISVTNIRSVEKLKRSLFFDQCKESRKRQYCYQFVNL